jgi:hypothetical protein
VRHVEAGLYRSKFDRAVQEQARPDEQHKTESELDDHQTVAQTGSPEPGSKQGTFRPERGVQGRSCGVKSGSEPKHNTGGQGKNERKYKRGSPG